MVGGGLSSGKHLEGDREKGLDSAQLYVGLGLSGLRNNYSLGRKDKMKEQNTK